MQSMLAGGGNQGGLGPESRCQWGGRDIRGEPVENIGAGRGKRSRRAGRRDRGGPGEAFAAGLESQSWRAGSEAVEAVREK